MSYPKCNNDTCSANHNDGKVPTTLHSNGLCTYCNSIKRHEGYGHVKINYINVCGCGQPIPVREHMCWDCHHDVDGCDMCHPNH